MSLFRKPSIDEAARREAALGVHSVDEQIVRRRGRRPPDFDPVGNHEHGQVASSIGRGTEIAEWTEDLHRAEEEQSRHPSVWGLNLGIAFCFAVEVLGGVLVMRALGVDEAERLPLGMALALALIGITAVTSGRTGPTPRERRDPGTGSDEPPPDAPAPRTPTGRPPRLSVTAFILAAYSLLVVALAVVRMRLSAEDGGGADALPETVVMVATSVGPAWLAEYFMRRRRPAVLVGDEIKRLKRRIRAAERERTRAAGFLTQLSRRQSSWDDEDARLRASFESEHRLATAESGRPVTPTLTDRS